MKQWVLFIGFLWAFSFVAQAQCWEEVTIEGYEEEAFYNVRFPDSLNGWIWGWNGIILQTKDGGTTWRRVPIYSNTFQFGYVLDRDTAWFWGRADTLHYTYDGGDSWAYFNTFKSRGILHFIDSQNGWLDTFGRIYYTDNGGRTWQMQSEVFEIGQFGKFYFDKNTLTGWACGQDLIKTEDGQNWRNFSDSIGRFSQLRGNFCFDKDRCWFAGIQNSDVGGQLYKTDDGGITWTKKFPEVNKPFFNNIYFPDSLSGWIIGGQGAIYRTIDKGETWHKKKLITDKGLFGIDFTSPNNGWVVGALTRDAVVLRYRPNLPFCIEAVNLHPVDTMSAIRVMDTLTWYHARGCTDGYRLTIGFTPGGGEVADNLDVGYDTVYIIDYMVPADTTLYVTIIPYGPMGSPVACSSFELHTGTVSNKNPTEAIPYLNIFPNPTQSVITGELYMPVAMNADFELYDTGGRKVFSMNKNLNPGRNVFSLPVYGIPAGVYFLRIQAESGVVTRRVMITP